MLAVNLRANSIENRDAQDLVEQLSDNKTLFNLDLRENLDVSQKVFRKLALKLLANYT